MWQINIKDIDKCRTGTKWGYHYISVTDGTIEADVTGTVKEERIYGEERKL